MKIKGEVHYKVYEGSELIEEHHVKNLVVDGGHEAIAMAMAGIPNKEVAEIGFGTGTSAPALSDTDLTGRYSRPILSATPGPAPGQLTIDWTLSIGENNGVKIEEFGLFTADGTMISRRLAVNPINKTNAIYLEGQWILTF